jgi:hypothetical protein
VLEEVTAVDAPRELPVGQEVVVATVLLAGTLQARRRRHGELELGHALEQRADQRPLSGARRARDDKDGLFGQAEKPSEPSSSSTTEAGRPNG